MSRLEIRRMEFEDIAAVRALYVHLLGDTFSQFPDQALEVYKRDWTEDLIAERLQDTRRALAVAADSADGPVGYVLGAPPDGGVASVIWLAISRDRRGQGIGRALMETVRAEYQRMGCHKLRLFAKTRDAVQFYRKFGMIVEGDHPNYWWRQHFWSLGMDI